MKGSGWFLTIAATACLLAFAQTGTAQGRRNKGHILVPQSSVARPADLGVKAHTHLLVMMPEVGHFTGAPQPSELPPFPGLFSKRPRPSPAFTIWCNIRTQDAVPTKPLRIPRAAAERSR